MDINSDRKTFPSRQKTSSRDQDFSQAPVWWRVWAGFCLMVAVSVLACGGWVVYRLVEWVTSK